MKHLVIATCGEDTSWSITNVPAEWSVQEVEKDKDVPNTGREPSSFLWAILKLYPNLQPDDQLAFVQGNPYDHCPWLSFNVDVEDYIPLGDYTYTSLGNGSPHHPGLPLAECYESWLGKPFPGAVLFAPGGQFMCTGAHILAHPLSLYERLLKEMEEGEKPWVLERLWPALLGGL